MKASYGLRHPREVALYVLLGRTEYRELKNLGHTCFQGKDDRVLPFNVNPNTDIHEHLPTLYMLTLSMHLKSVVELGVRDGESTLALLHAVRPLHGRVHSWDISSSQIATNRVSADGLESFWDFHEGNDLDAKWSDPIDHLFIDTSHEYDHTLSELQKFEPLVVGGGVITMHDSVSCPPVKRAAYDYFRKRLADRSVWMMEYPNNNGLLVIFKRAHPNERGLSEPDQASRSAS
jgi:predicted O-methyltransferase YrrM